MVFLIILLFLIISSIDIVPMFQKKMWRGIAAHTIIMLAALTLLLLEFLGIPYPNPTEVIEKVIVPISPLK